MYIRRYLFLTQTRRPIHQTNMAYKIGRSFDPISNAQARFR